jgi:hypothetical protein
MPARDATAHRCRSSCTFLTAFGLPGITGDDVLERSDVMSRRFDGTASLWQLLAISADRLASPLRFIMCEACLHTDCQACFLGAYWSQTAVCGAIRACVGSYADGSRGHACLQPSERLCLSVCVLVSCGRQWTYDASRSTCSMSCIGYWNEVKRLICYLHIITTQFQPPVMSSTSIASF